MTDTTWITDYIDIPFVSKGRDHAGCDCWGLVRLVLAERYDIFLPSYVDEYDDAMNGRRNATVIHHAIASLPVESVKTPVEGDIAVMRYHGEPSHVGLVLPDGRIMHTDHVIGVTLASPDSLRLRGRIRGYYRVS